MMTHEHASFEEGANLCLSAAATLVLAHATLKAAFCSAGASLPEADSLIHEAFELGRRSVAMSIEEMKL